MFCQQLHQAGLLGLCRGRIRGGGPCQQLTDDGGPGALLRAGGAALAGDGGGDAHIQHLLGAVPGLAVQQGLGGILAQAGHINKRLPSDLGQLVGGVRLGPQLVGVAIGAFFGNLNWKWLSAIIIGLMVIAGTAGILMYMTETEDLSSLSITITDSLKNAAPLPPTSK